MKWKTNNATSFHNLNWNVLPSQLMHLKSMHTHMYSMSLLVNVMHILHSAAWLCSTWSSNNETASEHNHPSCYYYNLLPDPSSHDKVNNLPVLHYTHTTLENGRDKMIHIQILFVFTLFLSKLPPQTAITWCRDGSVPVSVTGQAKIVCWLGWNQNNRYRLCWNHDDQLLLDIFPHSYMPASLGH